MSLSLNAFEQGCEAAPALQIAAVDGVANGAGAFKAGDCFGRLAAPKPVFARQRHAAIFRVIGQQCAASARNRHADKTGVAGHQHVLPAQQ